MFFFFQNFCVALELKQPLFFIIFYDGPEVSLSLQQFFYFSSASFTSLQHFFTCFQHSFYFPSPFFASLHHFFTPLQTFFLLPFRLFFYFPSPFFHFPLAYFFTSLHRFLSFSSGFFPLL